LAHVVRFFGPQLRGGQALCCYAHPSPIPPRPLWGDLGLRGAPHWPSYGSFHPRSSFVLYVLTASASGDAMPENTLTRCVWAILRCGNHEKWGVCCWEACTWNCSLSCTARDNTKAYLWFSVSPNWCLWQANWLKLFKNVKFGSPALESGKLTPHLTWKLGWTRWAEAPGVWPRASAGCVCPCPLVYKGYHTRYNRWQIGYAVPHRILQTLHRVLEVPHGVLGLDTTQWLIVGPVAVHSRFAYPGEGHGGTPGHRTFHWGTTQGARCAT